VPAYNISFIGAGNVAEALCLGFRSAGHTIVSVASRHGLSSKSLAAAVGAEWRQDLSVPGNCDILIIAVTDTAIEEVAREAVIPGNTIVVHTAGSVALSALRRDKRAGVFYPLQTFTKGFIPELSKVPFFIEATDTSTLAVLKELGSMIGSGAWNCSSEQRRHLHVAAVFVNNFSNFMMTTGEVIAANAGFDPALMRPLIEETARKALFRGPAMAQTGPAVRNDTGTIKSHLDLLSFSPEYQKLYRLLSSMISDYYKKSSG
jgi:predicted short-subunit dehydrogenase-like oxidoreductase (DUF2520 family)